MPLQVMSFPADEKSVQELTKKLASFRKNSDALKTGKMMHYIPEEGLYVYFRYTSLRR